MKAFVIMPFAPDFDEIYNLFIATTLTGAGFDVFRADTILSQRNILEDVVLSIVESDLVVADLTGSNANVYYELGLAHALGKKVLLLTQSIDELPFDLRSYRVISYDTHFASIQKAKDELAALALGARDGSIPFGSPIKDFALASLIKPACYDVTVSDAPTDHIDLGFLDHMVEMEDGFSKLTEIMQQVTEWTESIGTRTAEEAAKINEINANPQQGAARKVQMFARTMAEFQSDYSKKLSKANFDYDKTLKHVESSLEYIVGGNVPTSEENQTQLAEFLDVLAGVEEGALVGKTGFLGMAEMLDQMPKMEQRLTRSMQETSKELKRFVVNIDQTIAMISRARGIGERVLRQARVAVVEKDLLAEPSAADDLR